MRYYNRLLVACLVFFVTLHITCEDESVLPFVDSAPRKLNNTCSNNSETGECLTVSTVVPLTDEENTTVLDSLTGNTESTEDGNVTDVTEYDNETTTEISTEAVTTIIPKVTTEVSTTTVEPVDTHLEPEDICSCDLLVDICDVNCCCDEDCSSGERRAFSTCNRRVSPTLDSRYCYQTQFIYRNNTEHKVARSKEGLFCIVKDNLPVQFNFKARRVVTTLKEFNKLYVRRWIHRWPSQDIKRLVFNPSIPYRAGNIVWSLSNTALIPFSLPTKVISAHCQRSSPVRFLMDWSGVCSRYHLECSASALNAAMYFEGISIISQPQLVNKTYLEQQDCPNNTCIPITAFLCPWSYHGNTDIDDCPEISIIDFPEVDNSTNTCNSVVKKVKYLVHHNGTQGILKVEAYFWLINLNLSQEELTQSFSVSFLWTNRTRKPFERSGNPGYLIGKPVLAGRKVIHPPDKEDEPDKEAIELSEERSKWLTIPKGMQNGVCDWGTGEGNRQSVTFDENLRSCCSLALNPTNFSSAASCAFVQKQVLQLLAGDAIENVTEAKDFNKFIALFGNSNVEEIGEWVAVLLENIPSYTSPSSSKRDSLVLICTNIITSLHIDIVFASVGSLANPQAKILGATFKFGSPRDLEFECGPVPCANIDKEVHQHFEVLSSVSFLDVTKPPIAHFPDPPVYEVKLPHDFFYPFLRNSKGCVVNICPSVLLLGLIMSLLKFHR